MRLPLRGVRIMELIGRGAAPDGEDGGETVILSLPLNSHAGWNNEKGERGEGGYQIELWRCEEGVTESSGVKKIRN